MQLKNLGDRRMVMSYLRQHQEVTDLYMVPDTDYTAETDEIFRYCEDHMIRFYALPVFMEFLTKRMELSHLGSTMLLSVRNEPLQDPVNRGVKRLFDILTSGLFLLTVFPIVYLIAGIIIKIQSPGPILFKQKAERTGRKRVLLPEVQKHAHQQRQRPHTSHQERPAQIQIRQPDA